MTALRSGFRALLAGGASLVALTCSAHAQDESPQPPSEAIASTQAAGPAVSPQDADIIVTAMRRATAVDNTALTVSVLSSTALEKSGVIDSITLQNAVPGLVLSRASGFETQVYIRGIGNNITGVSGSNSVATYIDGVYISNSLQIFQRFSDVERIEVLKGPQAVLYGRNATGGAILVTSKAPSFTPELSADASYGNYDTYELRGSVSGPIVADKIAARISFRQYGRDGYFKNLTDGSRPDDEKQTAVRAALLFEFSPDFSVTLRGHYSKANMGDFFKIYRRDDWRFALVPSQYNPDPWAQTLNSPADNPSRDKGIMGTIKWTMPLGEITSVTSYRDFKAGPLVNDLDGFGATAVFMGQNVTSPLALIGEVVTNRSFWQETYLATPADRPLSFIGGGNYTEENAVAHYRRNIPSGPSFFDRPSKVKAFSVFGELNWNISSRITLSGGARYSKERRRYSSQGISPTTLRPIGTRVSNSGSWDKITPSAGIEFRRVPGELWFFNFTTGFKSGGFGETNPLDSFEPETVTAYELGLKKRWLDGRLQTNFSAFYYDYKGLQVQRLLNPSLVRQIDNAKGAKIYGLDTELRAQVTPDLRFGANIGYLHSEYGSLFLCDDLLGPCTLGPVVNPATYLDVKGNQLARAPKWGVGLNGDWEHEFDNGHRLGLHLDATYTARTYFTPNQHPLHSRDPYWVLNGEARYEPSEHFTLALYCQNLTDKLYEQSIVTQGLMFLANGTRVPGNGTAGARWAPPRTYGIRLSYRY